MNAANFLINTLFDLYLMVVLLRVWLQLAKADFYNPFSQFVVKATNPFVVPLRRIIPGLGGLDLASIILALVVAALKIVVLSLVMGAAMDPVYTAVASLFIVIKEVFTLVFWILIVRAILSWVSQGRSPIESVMHQLTEPMLAPIRRILPSMGGLDLSILVLIISLQFLQILVQDFIGRLI